MMMRRTQQYFAVAFMLLPTLTRTSLAQGPTVGDDVVFAERDGIVAIEAEHFLKQSSADVRAFYMTNAETKPGITPDGDTDHVAGASGGAYMEVLPDTRRTHADKLIKNENFSPDAGKMAVLHYNINFATPGRYYVWVRAYSSGPEDNGLHVGIDGQWPDSGQRMQWCDGKNLWRWESKQRTDEVHCGEPYKVFLDVQTPGQHEVLFSMREDGFEFDKFILTSNRDFVRPEGLGPESKVRNGSLPKPFPYVEPKTAHGEESSKESDNFAAGSIEMPASMFAEGKNVGYYLDRGKWLAVDPDHNDSGTIERTFPFPTGVYDVTLKTIGEDDGMSSYKISVDGESLAEYTNPLGQQTYQEGTEFNSTWKTIAITDGAIIKVASSIGSVDGTRHSRARWSGIEFKPADKATQSAVAQLLKQRFRTQAKSGAVARKGSPTKSVSDQLLQNPRQPDGDGSVEVEGELKTWHKITLNLNGPFAHEKDNVPNPFTDYRMTVTFTHDDGVKYEVPGYFAADGNAADSSMESGTVWRAHFAPDRVGTWNYHLSFAAGLSAAIDRNANAKALSPFDGRTGSFQIAETDKHGRDMRAQGRLKYVGKHYLQFAETGEYFLKVGADAPETLLAYKDFDNTHAGNLKKAPLKSWSPHVKDWNAGDPTWGDGKGKGLIGAVNYLSGKGCNAFSFLTYNAGGDGDNVWPFIDRDDKLHYDCSKLDQWGTVFEHGTNRGMYLHFKMQETENDDDNRGNGRGSVPESLDGGDLGVQRKLYCRELIARFGHNLALNWNLGEENTQSTAQHIAMIDYIADMDAYDHNIVIHTFPDQQDRVYQPLLGSKSKLTGASLQNSGLETTHAETFKWVEASAQAGKPWVVAFDESGSAGHAQCPDLGYNGFDGHDRSGKMAYTQHKVRKQTLWGTLMAGGAGCEYYFGYQFDENDIVCEDWRSRDQSWDYCRIAIGFFHDNKIPFWEMTCADELVGNANHEVSKLCFAKADDTYLVYLPDGGTSSLDLSAATGEFNVHWFNPRSGGELATGSIESVSGGGTVSIGTAPTDASEDWLVVIRRRDSGDTKLSGATSWKPILSSDGSLPVARHEAGYVRVGDRFYLIGGRRKNPVSIYDPSLNVWLEGSVSPVEMHHFQPVVVGKLIYVAGALTGPYPGETPLPNMYIYDTEHDIWRQGPGIPTDRLRGSTGNVVHEGKLYLASGIFDGRRGDHKKWFDAYDLKGGFWTRLPDCPRARDHHQAAVVGGKMYLIGGRQSNAPSNTMGNTIDAVDVFDFQTKQWSTLAAAIPTQRAGLFLTMFGDQILAIGGESLGQKLARNNVECLDTKTKTWRSLSPMLEGRHGTGAVLFEDRVYIASGSGNLGGGPELTTQESVDVAALLE